MGWWKSEHGTIGDTPADIIGNAFEEIKQAYLDAADRLPTQGEMAGLIEFCSRGMLVPACGDPSYNFDEEDDNAPRVEPGGRQGVMGFGLEGVPDDCLANVDPATGEHFRGASPKSEEK